MIHKLEVGYAISSGGSWLPGVYNDKRAANYAFRFDDEDLSKLQVSVNPHGIITFEMLQEFRRFQNVHNAKELLDA